MLFEVSEDLKSSSVGAEHWSTGPIAPSRADGFMVGLRPASTGRRAVSASLRSLQNQGPPDLVQRLACVYFYFTCENEKSFVYCT